MFEKLEGTKRLLMETELLPVQGERFQSTGFPDLGAATYQLPDGTRMLLVESAQSMANRLEGTIIGPDNEVISELKGLSYIRVRLTGGTETTTNSLIEAHRINSPYIISDEDFKSVFTDASGYQTNMPLNWQKIAHALFNYDINSLLHGVFLSNLGDGRVKVPRALSAFIEARNAREVVSGGIKFNPIDPSGTLQAEKLREDVYSNVPYQRVEFTADSIKAHFNLDVGLLSSYDMGQDASELLMTLAIYKVRRFLEEGTRLRTACDLKMKSELRVTEPQDFTVPSKAELLGHLKEKIKACRPMFADPSVTEITTRTTIVKRKSESGETE